MLKNIECERRIWSTKHSQEKTERHLYIRQSKKIKNVRRGLQSNKYGAQLGPVATGGFGGLSPQTKLQVPPN